jgi:hypothetical protein
MKLLVGIFSFLFLLAGAAFAQRSTLVIGGGLTKDMRSKTPNLWNMGFVLRAAFIAPTSGKIAFGGSAAYHSRGADGDGWAKHTAELNNFTSYNLSSVSGSQSVFEIGPSVRVQLSENESKVRPYLHVGIALLLISDGDVTLKGSYTSPGVTGTGTITYTSQSLTGFGGQIGIPLIIANAVEIQPMYTLYTAGGDLYHHYTINIGYALNLGNSENP